TRAGLAQIANREIAYDSQDRPLVDMGWSESGLGVRAFGAPREPQRWYFCAGTDLGLAADGHGAIYLLRMKGKQPALLRLDEETGQTTKLSDGQFDRYFPATSFGPHVGGMTMLNNTLYVADTDNNRLSTTHPADKVFVAGGAVPSPTSPCADPGRKLVWVLSAHANVVALGENGQIVYQFPCPVTGAQSIAMSGNRLAILSYDTGKIHILDITDPAHPAAFRTIGTGDGPAGSIQAD